MIGRRFEVATARLGFNRGRRKLRTDLFTPPAQERASSRCSNSVTAGRGLALLAG